MHSRQQENGQRGAHKNEGRDGTKSFHRALEGTPGVPQAAAPETLTQLGLLSSQGVEAAMAASIFAFVAAAILLCGTRFSSTSISARAWSNFFSSSKIIAMAR